MTAWANLANNPATLTEHWTCADARSDAAGAETDYSDGGHERKRSNLRRVQTVSFCWRRPDITIVALIRIQQMLIQHDGFFKMVCAPVGHRAASALGGLDPSTHSPQAELQGTGVHLLYGETTPQHRGTDRDQLAKLWYLSGPRGALAIRKGRCCR